MNPPNPNPNPNAGGFLPPSSLLSPPASIASPTAPSASKTPLLPTPRTHPLPPGSKKESLFIAHVDSRLLAISRRYENRAGLDGDLEDGDGAAAVGAEGTRAGVGGGWTMGGGEGEGGGQGTGKGYTDFAEMAGELGAVVDVVWVSGTRAFCSFPTLLPVLPFFQNLEKDIPKEKDKGQRVKELTGFDLSGGRDRRYTASLQIPYLLTIALTVSTALSSFPFKPKATFRLLQKLDLAFASLLRGGDGGSIDAMSGFNGGGGGRRVGGRVVSVTQKVRIRGVVERTRVRVVEVAATRGGADIDGSVGGGRGEENGADGRDAGGMMTASETELEDGNDNNNDDDDEDFNATVTTDEDVGHDEYMSLDGNHGRWEMEVARVYERTIVELGMALDFGSNGDG